MYKYLEIKEVRGKNLGKLVSMSGMILQASDVKQRVMSSRFECPSCGAIQTILHDTNTLKEPNKCGCGRKGKMRVLSQEITDIQKIVLIEDTQLLEGNQEPKKMAVYLEGDLTSPEATKAFYGGNKIRVVGIIKSVPLFDSKKKDTPELDKVIFANSITNLEEDFYSLKISGEEEKKIMELSKDVELMNKMIHSIAPDIKGEFMTKEVLLYSLVGGVELNATKRRRGEIHVLLAGDPGVAKTVLARSILPLAPKAKLAGSGSSAVGLTAAVVKDQFLGSHMLQAGVLVLANNGHAVIDEFDKVGKEDRDKLHEPMEDGMVIINKANIHAILSAKTSLIVACNPKLGRFDPYTPPAQQIDMPPSLLNRFDYILIFKDIPDLTRDRNVLNSIFDLFDKEGVIETPIPVSLLRKYISYARQKIKPKLTLSAKEEIDKILMELRGRYGKEKEDGRTKAVPINTRQYYSLIQSSIACAKLRLSETVSKEDVKRAGAIFVYALEQVAVDPATGKMDVDILEGGLPTSKRAKVEEVYDRLKEIKESGELVSANSILYLLTSLKSMIKCFFPSEMFCSS